jgi:hypothetical protein
MRLTGADDHMFLTANPRETLIGGLNQGLPRTQQIVQELGPVPAAQGPKSRADPSGRDYRVEIIAAHVSILAHNSPHTVNIGWETCHTCLRTSLPEVWDESLHPQIRQIPSFRYNLEIVLAFIRR